MNLTRLTVVATLAITLTQAGCALDEIDETDDADLASEAAGDDSCEEDDPPLCLTCIGDGGDGGGDADELEYDDPDTSDESGDLDLEGTADGEGEGGGGDPMMAGGRGKKLYEVLQRLARCGAKGLKIAKMSKEAIRTLFIKTIKTIPGFKRYYDEVIGVLKKCPTKPGAMFDQIADFKKHLDALKRIVAKQKSLPPEIKEMAELILTLLDKRLRKLANCFRRWLKDQHPQLRQTWLRELDNLGL